MIENKNYEQIYLQNKHALYPKLLFAKCGWNWPSGSLFCNYLPLEKWLALHWNKLIWPFFFFEASQFNLVFHLKLSNEIFSQFSPSFSRSFNILANKKFSLLLLHLLLQECEKWLKKGQTCTFLEHSLCNPSLID